MTVSKRADGQLAYETWLGIVGHASAAVHWDKLTVRAQQAWTEVARACERRTLDLVAAEHASREKMMTTSPTAARAAFARSTRK